MISSLSCSTSLYPEPLTVIVILFCSISILKTINFQLEGRRAVGKVSTHVNLVVEEVLSDSGDKDVILARICNKQ